LVATDVAARGLDIKDIRFGLFIMCYMLNVFSFFISQSLQNII
jgi:hypothetical protein